ncbi:MAG: hypothetical protein HYZ25_15525 [Chloroflexi bacterium]|nr:hypothetical protein [Chloroflexota bacterium]
MKKIWTIVLENLTFRDLAGRRQPRAYAVLAGAILAMLLLAVFIALSNQWWLWRDVHAAPLAVSLPTEVIPPTPSLVEEQIPAGCPTDSGDWTLVPSYVSETYQIIQPACVYQGLEKTVAWALAVREGYSRAEATEMLGFSRMPMRALQEVNIPSDQGPLGVPVSFIPTNPYFTEWRLTEEGKPAVAYGLRGCFRTSTVVGNRLNTWGGDYPVVCLVAEDAINTRIVYSLFDHVYTASAVPMRSFLLFGYLGEGEWVWLGTQTDPWQPITDLTANARDRLTMASLYDSRPWDAIWLQNTYGLTMQPPPQGWQDMTSEYEKQTILDGLSDGAEGGQP